jgi:predicted transcriptional regulator
MALEAIKIKCYENIVFNWCGMSAMSRSKIDLEHNTRKTIYNHIAEYPGVTFSTLKSFYDISESTLRYHLKYLERGDRITPRLEGGQLHFYPNMTIDNVSRISTKNSRKSNLTNHQERILITIKKNPGINQTELMDKTSFKRHVLSYNISKLIDKGMVRKSNHVRNVCYEYMTDDLLQSEMLKVLVIKLLNNEIDENTFLMLKNKLNKK